jgi:hypothetical protein
VRGAHAPPGGTSVDVGRGRPLVVDDKGVGHEEKFSRNPRVNRTGCVVCACVYCGVRRIVFARNRILVHFVHAVVFFSLVCLSDALRLNLRTEKQFVVANREKGGQNISNFFSIRIISRRFFMWEKKSVNLCRSLIAVKHFFGGRSRTRKERTDCHLCY